MLRTRYIGFIVFLIIGIILSGIAFTLPKNELIIDNFEDNDISDWDESGFETESYKVSSLPKGNVADIEIKTGQDIVCRHDDPPLYCKYGSFQRTINKNFEKFKNGKISFWLKFSNNFENIKRLKLSLGDMVSGPNQENKVDYYYKPKTNNWQFVSFKINNPSSIIGNLNLQYIQKIRFNIEYGKDFYESGEIFHVYIDDIKLTKYSITSLILFALGITFFIISFISFFWRETQRKLRRFFNVIDSLSDKHERKESIKLIINSTFQYLLVTYLIFLLINKFNPIELINLNYFLIMVLVLGVLAVFLPTKKPRYKLTNKLDHILIFFLGILGAMLVYIKIKELGILSYIISIIAGILIIILSYLILGEEDEI